MQKSVNKSDVKIILAILLGGTTIPFLVGWTAPQIFDFSPFMGNKQNMLALTIVIGIAMAVTSIPVISRIFLDLHIIKTRFARIVLSAATIEDIILWVALAIATGIVSAGDVSVPVIVSTVLITLSFFLLGLLVLPRFIRMLTAIRVNFLIKASVYGYVLFLLLFFTVAAGLLHINIVFGAFLAGILVSLAKDRRFAVVKSTIKDIGIAFFIPVYFAIVGLKLDLIHHFNPFFFVGFFVFATFFKTFGTFIAARLIKKDIFSSLNLAVAMNTRGGPGIVLATVAFDMGIINEEFFVTLVLLAVVTSLLAGYWFSFVLSRKLPLLR